MKRIMSRLFARLKNEDGSSTVEFVLIFPILFGIFMSGWETSTYIMRYTLLDRALDITMRDLRLGRMPGADHDDLKDAICDRTIRMTGSVGIAVTPDDGTEFDEVRKKADIAMYKSKQMGKNRFRNS